MENNVKTYREAVDYLTNIVRMLNEEFFNNELPECQVTIQSRRGTYAHYTLNEVWQEPDTGYHELNLAAEHISRPIANVIASCQHELVHHYNFIHGIKDTSGSGRFYHNRNFKDTAESHGLIISHHEKYGWTVTDPGQPIFDFITRHDLKDIQISRQEPGLFGIGGAANGNGTIVIGGGASTLPPFVTKKSSSMKMICPCCKKSLRVTRGDWHLKCLDCDEELEYVF